MQTTPVTKATKQCPNCGQFKLSPRRTSVIVAGIFSLLLVALLVSWGQFFEVAQWIFGLIALGLFLGSIFVKGRIFTNCKARSP
jgi:hypothetical protein